ncbi:MAG TPA: LacI family DNA-binding transcriptional regulator [Candidatus Sulfopaludibacter sp.]|jgi:DNA-binding LacI/PurR family transcriptional regulator|nr:LacI family DNA-binding transcriptional regulator [Candidatus Sulfopaludibacter sp.]
MKLEQVARRAKVSTATVSRVLNNASLVKSSTRARVMKAIEELKYHPNLHARSLAGGKSRTIGVIVSNLENPFFFDIYKTIEADAHANGYEVLMANTDYRSEQLVTSIRLMIGRRVAGLAAIVSEMAPELIEELNDSRTPVVFYDVGTPRQNITNIRVDYRRGIEKLVDYLHSLGHRRLGFIGHHAILGPINERMKAVMDAVARIPSLEVRSAADADTLEGGRLATRALLASGFHPTALVCVNDITAVGALRELRESGIRVPQDISVTGFDNVKLSEFCYPALTTVHIPRDRVGHIISGCLMPKPGAAEITGEIVIDPELVLRDSTGPVSAPSETSN